MEAPGSSGILSRVRPSHSCSLLMEDLCRTEPVGMKHLHNGGITLCCGVPPTPNPPADGASGTDTSRALLTPVLLKDSDAGVGGPRSDCRSWFPSVLDFLYRGVVMKSLTLAEPRSPQASLVPARSQRSTLSLSSSLFLLRPSIHPLFVAAFPSTRPSCLREAACC